MIKRNNKLLNSVQHLSKITKILYLDQLNTSTKTVLILTTIYFLLIDQLTAVQKHILYLKRILYIIEAIYCYCTTILRYSSYYLLLE